MATSAIQRVRDWKNELFYGRGRRARIAIGQRLTLWCHVLTHARAWKWFKLWRTSLKPGHSPAEDEYPLITFDARAFLDSVVQPDMTVFEYGTGGSTLYFAKRVRRVVSVEHDAPWHEHMTRLLRKHGIDNCEYTLREPTPLSGAEPAYSPTSFSSAFKAFAGVSYRDYVQAIDPYKDESFDIVLVDGRARVSCIHRAMAKVRPGGYLMLDNSDRPQYDAGLKLLSDWSRHDFHGLGPNCRFLWRTTAWRRPDAPLRQTIASSGPVAEQVQGAGASCD